MMAAGKRWQSFSFKSSGQFWVKLNWAALPRDSVDHVKCGFPPLYPALLLITEM